MPRNMPGAQLTPDKRLTHGRAVRAAGKLLWIISWKWPYLLLYGGLLLLVPRRRVDVPYGPTRRMLRHLPKTAGPRWPIFESRPYREASRPRRLCCLNR